MKNLKKPMKLVLAVESGRMQLSLLCLLMPHFFKRHAQTHTHTHAMLGLNDLDPALIGFAFAFEHV